MLGAIAALRWHKCLRCHEARARWCPVLPSIFARFVSATQPMAMEVFHVLVPDIWWAIVAYLLPIEMMQLAATHGAFRGARMGNIILGACKGHLAETVFGICPDPSSLFQLLASLQHPATGLPGAILAGSQLLQCMLHAVYYRCDIDLYCTPLCFWGVYKHLTAGQNLILDRALSSTEQYLQRYANGQKIDSIFFFKQRVPPGRRAGSDRCV